MRTALVFVDGAEQIVLTPETKLETSLLERISESEIMKVTRTAFYETVGHFFRFDSNHAEKSTILTLRPKDKLGVKKQWEPGGAISLTKEQMNRNTQLLRNRGVEPKTVSKAALLVELCNLIREVEDLDHDQA